MAEIVLFHHVLGRTRGLAGFADRLRAAGHTVHLPDLFDGATFDTIEAGMEHARTTGFEEIIARGEAAVADLPPGLVYGGFSLGALPAQKLGQHRPGTKAVVLYEGAVPLSAFGGVWPDGVPLQIHARESDELAEVDVLEGLAQTVPGAQLHLYPGSGHLFTDAGFAAHDAAATDLVIERTLALLSRVG